MNKHLPRTFLILAVYGITSPSIAEQSSWISTSLTWTQDLAAQTTLMQALADPAQQSRTGFETAAGVTWSELDYQGGYSLGLQGRYDKGFKRATDISEAGASASMMRSISSQWLAKLSAYGALYRNQAFPASGYNSLGAETTLGYFGSRASGIDLKLGWTGENHNQDSGAYKTNRIYSEAIWYLPHDENRIRWRISSRLQSNNADNSRFDYSSLQLKTGFTHWKLGKALIGLSLQWQQDNYDSHAVAIPSGTDFPPLQNPPNRMGQGNRDQAETPMAVATSSATRTDTLLFATLEGTQAISKTWQLSLSADAGRYQSDPANTDRWFYDLVITSQWRFD